jgi:bifunctional DNase/RNase
MSELIEVELIGVRVEMPSNQPILLMKEKSGIRYLPIWIGAVEASAIAFAQEGMKTPRPMTHELIIDLAATVHFQIARVEITNLLDGVFYSDLVLTTPNGEAVVSARPSDSITLAIRSKAPIYVVEDLLADAGIEIPEAEGEIGGEDEVERFREFLDQINPEDFAG